MAESTTLNLEIVRTTLEPEIDHCALLMSESEPFVTLKIDYTKARAGMNGDYREIYIAKVDGHFAGFVVLMFAGVLRGYIQTICIKPAYQSKGIGTALIRYGEERIATEFPNVFICVSSFNRGAQKLYYSLGYEKIGELKDHIISGADEYILRKQTCPIAEFKPAGS
jgi:ribosomal protein S18 acetylase RimI-like enzyme